MVSVLCVLRTHAYSSLSSVYSCNRLAWVFPSIEEPGSRLQTSCLGSMSLRLLEPRHLPPSEVMDASGAVPIRAKAHVMALSAVDSRTQSFAATVWVQLSWRVAGAQHTDTRAATEHWRPLLTFTNATDKLEGADKPAFRLVYDATGGTCFLSWTVQGVFAHRFALRAFPFDSQRLVVRAVLWRSPLEAVDPSTGEVTPFRGRIVFDTTGAGPSLLYEDGFVDFDAWAAHETDAVALRAGHTDEKFVLVRFSASRLYLTSLSSKAPRRGRRPAILDLECGHHTQAPPRLLLAQHRVPLLALRHAQLHILRRPNHRAAVGPHINHAVHDPHVGRLQNRGVNLHPARRLRHTAGPLHARVLRIHGAHGGGAQHPRRCVNSHLSHD